MDLKDYLHQKYSFLNSKLNNSLWKEMDIGNYSNNNGTKDNIRQKNNHINLYQNFTKFIQDNLSFEAFNANNKNFYIIIFFFILLILYIINLIF
ncbi:Hypothetical protein KVN_LOCUS280 [uncultured virus]|nr:Hypothetical protein KVN_LOCUS280 [uncultured virus]